MSVLDGWVFAASVVTVVAVGVAALSMLSPNVRRPLPPRPGSGQATGPSSMLVPGVLVWALGCTLQAPFVYLWVDAHLGGHNVTNLLYRSAVVLALGCLEVMVIRAVHGERRPVRETLTWALVVAMIGLQIALFGIGDWPVTDAYLGRYTGEPTRELFVAVLPVCVGLYGVQVAAVAFRGLPLYGEWTTRWGVWLIGLAALVDLAWITESLAAGAVRLFVDRDFAMSGIVDPLWEVAVVSMASLTAAGVVFAAARPVVVPVWRRLLLLVSLPITDRAMEAHPEFSVYPRSVRRRHAFRSRGEEAEVALYQRWAELEDNIRLRQFRPRGYERVVIRMMGVAATTGVTDSLIEDLSRPDDLGRPDDLNRPDDEPPARDPERIESTP
jgi:hypothetical protein